MAGFTLCGIQRTSDYDYEAPSEGKQPPHMHTYPPTSRDVTKALPVIIRQHAEANCPSSAGFCLMRGGSPGPHGAPGQLTRWRQSLLNSDGDDRVGGLMHFLQTWCQNMAVMRTCVWISHVCPDSKENCRFLHPGASFLSVRIRI